MKKYSFRFAVAILTFAFGITFATPWFSELLFSKLFITDEINEEVVQVQSSEQSEELSFEYAAHIACGISSTSRGLVYVSDGTEIFVTSLSYIKSGKQVRKNFESQLKKADAVYELSPILDEEKNEIGKKAIVQIKDKVLIISFSESKLGYEKFFGMTTITTPSLRHALAFQKEQESFRRSAAMANSIKP